MFRPEPDRLLPELSARQEVALLARTLWYEGYDDHLSGHITMRLPDGNLLCTPWDLLWPEVRASDIIVIDDDGNRVEGIWPVPPGIPIHTSLHRLRHAEVVVHGHPRWGTIWANMGRVPPIYDQSSMKGGGHIVCVKEYGGPVDRIENADAAARAIGTNADLALLMNHGVLVIGHNIRSAHVRAVALELRCRVAHHVEAGGGGTTVPLDAQELAQVKGRDPDNYRSYWAAMVRQEIRRDPSVLA